MFWWRERSDGQPDEGKDNCADASGPHGMEAKSERFVSSVSWVLLAL